jgi:hypothetical protein
MIVQVVSLAIFVRTALIAQYHVLWVTTVLLKEQVCFTRKSNTLANWEHGTRKHFNAIRLTVMIAFQDTIVIKPH